MTCSTLSTWSGEPLAQNLPTDSIQHANSEESMLPPYTEVVLHPRQCAAYSKRRGKVILHSPEQPYLVQVRLDKDGPNPAEDVTVLCKHLKPMNAETSPSRSLRSAYAPCNAYSSYGIAQPRHNAIESTVQFNHRRDKGLIPARYSCIKTHLEDSAVAVSLAAAAPRSSSESPPVAQMHPSPLCVRRKSPWEQQLSVHDDHMQPPSRSNQSMPIDRLQSRTLICPRSSCSRHLAIPVISSVFNTLKASDPSPRLSLPGVSSRRLPAAPVAPSPRAITMHAIPTPRTHVL